MKYINDGTFEGMVSDDDVVDCDGYPLPVFDSIEVILCEDKPAIIYALQKNTHLPLPISGSFDLPRVNYGVWRITELNKEHSNIPDTDRLRAVIKGNGLLKAIEKDKGMRGFFISSVIASPLLAIAEVKYGVLIHIQGKGTGDYTEPFIISKMLDRESELDRMEGKFVKEKGLVEELQEKWNERHGGLMKEDVNMAIKRPHKETCIHCDKVIIGRDLEGFNFVMKRCAECLEKTVYNDGENMPVEDVEQRIKCCGNIMALFNVDIDNENPIVTLTWGCSSCCNLKEIMLDAKELKELLNALR